MRQRLFLRTMAVLAIGGGVLASQGTALAGTNSRSGSDRAPSVNEQLATMSAAQVSRYQTKLQRLHSACPVSPTATATCTQPLSKTLPYAVQHQQTSYWCGPATVSMLLSQYGVNLDQPTAAQQLGTTTNGTNRPPMASVANANQGSNAYVWQGLTLDSPNYAQGQADLMYYSAGDVWYNFPPAYNIETYGLDPVQHTYRYPLWRYNGLDWRHYFPGSGYDKPNNNLRVNDPYWTSIDWYGNHDVWAAIHNHPLVDQVLW